MTQAVAKVAEFLTTKELSARWGGPDHSLHPGKLAVHIERAAVHQARRRGPVPRRRYRQVGKLQDRERHEPVPKITRPSARAIADKQEIEVNKAELIASLALHTGETKTTVEKVLAGLDAVTCYTLNGGDEVLLPGIGKLVPMKKAARTARNPRTGDKIEKPATTVVKFRVAKSLKDLVA